MHAALPLLSVPMEDRPAWTGLRQPAKDSVIHWMTLMNALRIAVAGGEKLTAAAERIGTERAVGYGTLIRRHYLCEEKGWRGCIDGSRLGHSVVVVNDAFRTYWHGKVLNCQRNSAEAYRQLMAEWHRGDVIPGLPPPSLRGPRLPRGLSYKNLTLAVNMPSAAALALARQGFAAAKAHLATGPQDIGHLRPLEYILFDDVELDFLIVVPGCKKPVKLRLIVAMDLCSRMILSYAVRPGIERADGVEDGLKLTDMKACVARLLRTWGVPLEYQMHFICERGTATLPEGAKTALAELSDGRIVVHETSMIVGQVFAWKDKATGNSWGKAWLESYFNLLHNSLQHLPGQKGLSYARTPAELHGRKQALALVERLGDRLPAPYAALLKRPFLSCEEAMEYVHDAFARMARRTEHKLNGFDEIGIWRVSEGHAWKPEWELPANLDPISHTLEWDKRPEMPVERFMRRLPAIERRHAIHPGDLLTLVEERQEPVRFEKMAFSFTQEGRDYVYLPEAGLLPHLTEGKKYLLWFHRQDMAHVYVTRMRPDLGYVGMLRRFTAGKRGEREDAEQYLREKKTMLNRVSEQVKDAGLSRLRAAGDDLAENISIAQSALAESATERDSTLPCNATEGTVQRGGMEAMQHDRARAADAAAVKKPKPATASGALARLAAATED